MMSAENDDIISFVTKQIRDLASMIAFIRSELADVQTKKLSFILLRGRRMIDDKNNDRAFSCPPFDFEQCK